MKGSLTVCAGHRNGRDFMLNFIGQSTRVNTNTCRRMHDSHSLLCITATFPQMYRERKGYFSKLIGDLKVFMRFGVPNSDVAEDRSILEC